MSGAPALPAPHQVRVIVNAECGKVRAGGVSAMDLADAFARHGIEAEMRFAPGDRLDSGRLWQFLAKQRTRVGLSWFALRATVGSIEQVRDFEGPSSPTLEIDMHASRVRVATDGEVTTMRPPLHYCSRPQALRVFATPVPVG